MVPTNGQLILFSTKYNHKAFNTDLLPIIHVAIIACFNLTVQSLATLTQLQYLLKQQ